MGDPLVESLSESLDYLLFCLQDANGGDRGRDPFSFAMTWYLAALLHEEMRNVDKTKSLEEAAKSSPLIAELKDWHKINTSRQEERDTVVNGLKDIVKSLNYTVPS